jgi:hypothetical protein
MQLNGLLPSTESMLIDLILDLKTFLEATPANLVSHYTNLIGFVSHEHCLSGCRPAHFSTTPSERREELCVNQSRFPLF